MLPVRETVLFVCGAVFGLIVGFYLLVGVRDPIVFAGGLIGCSVVAGLLSARFGGRFWERIARSHWIPWL